MDPALIDRTSRSVLGIRYEEQPVRPMTISGIEGSLPAKILSTDTRGTSTRLVIARPGWGSRLAGAFTADIEVFVLKGDLRIGNEHLADYEYASVPAGGVVGGIATESGAVALLMTAGPVRFDTSTGGARADLVTGRPSDAQWVREIDGTGHFVHPLAATARGEVWIGSTRQDPDSPVWHRHPHDEETFVMEGQFSYQDICQHEVILTEAAPGSYFYRPAGTAHTGPIPTTDETVLTFNRALGGGHSNELLSGSEAHLSE